MQLALSLEDEPDYCKPFEDYARDLQRTSATYSPSFEAFCVDQGHPGLYEKALNGALALVFLPVTRGSATDYKGIKSGKSAAALLDKLKALYNDKIDSGDISKVESSRPISLELTHDAAFARNQFRHMIRRAVKAGHTVPQSNIDQAIGFSSRAFVLGRRSGESV